MFKEIVCNLCGSNRQKIVCKSPIAYQERKEKPYLVTEQKLIPPKEIVKCLKCGLIFAPFMGEVQELVSNYKEMVDEKYLQEEAGRRITARSILQRLNKFRKYGSCLLDIGCSAGFLLDEARKMDWEVYGVEYSNWAVEYAKEKFNLEIHNTSLEGAKFPSRFFDAVIMKDTIEHLSNPKQALIEIKRILKPTGILYINTPDIESLASRLFKTRWWGINQFHLYYFSKRTLSKLLKATGFESIKYACHARAFSLKYWLERFKNYNKIICRILVVFSRIGLLNKRPLKINLRDQIEVFARKSRRLEYLGGLEKPATAISKKKMKTIVVLPAYNAFQTLRATFDDIPKDIVDDVILVDDASKDNTVEIARELGIKVYTHKKNKGYGGNQKTCYTKALEMGADIVVMLHPDYQYDPKVISDLIEPIKKGEANAVFGSRIMKGGALEGHMPRWKYNSNILLTALANVILNTYLTEYHSGFRAYSAKYLKSVNFMRNSNNFVFDTEIIVQGVIKHMIFEEVPVRTRYFDEASTIKFWPCIIYGLEILKTLLKYILHTNKIIHFKQLG